MRAYQQVITTLIVSRGYRATKYLAPDFVIHATRIGGRIDGRSRSIDIQVKIGKPNHRQRLFIKDALKAGEPFPIRRVHVQPIPQRRGKRV